MLTGWQAAVVIIVLSISEMTLFLNDSDLSAVIMLGTMFAILAISALIAAITKSKLALYIMTASLVAFSAFFLTFAASPANIIFCFVLWVCFGLVIDESNLMPAWVVLLAIIEYLGVVLLFRLYEPVGFITGTTCALALVAASHFLNDQKARKPKPASPA